MKVIHIEGGIGNQMAAYAVYIAAKSSNPDDDFYFDTYVYDITDAHSTICMWNGYELDKVFGVNIPDIRTLFTNVQIKEQIQYLNESKFWDNGWNYSEVFIQMMSNYGISLKNAYNHVGDSETSIKARVKYLLKRLNSRAPKNIIVYAIRYLANKYINNSHKDTGKYLYKIRKGNYYYDLTLDFMKSKFLNDMVGEEVRNRLCFLEPLDEENMKYLQMVREVNSVSLHVRRTDYLQFNEDCYQFGYFKRSVKYIKSKVVNPVFFVFSDDLDWCKKNMDVIGLRTTDSVYFVNINKGKNSYRDMQIMSNCKHNIATKSSFGWWGSFLNRNVDKITCCQIGPYICTNQF